MNSPDLLERFGQVDSAAVSDALDALGLPNGFGGIRPLWGPAGVVGYAVTVQLEPRTEGSAGPHIGTTAVEAAGSESIIVIDNQSRVDVSCWGGILSLGASQQGVRAVIADGVCRDVGEARELGLPVFSRGSIPATARGRLQQRSAGGPVQLAGRTVSQGDVIVADDTGIAVVPADRAAEVVELAEGVVSREEAIAEEVRRGMPISQAMHDARLAGDPTSTDQGYDSQQEER